MADNFGDRSGGFFDTQAASQPPNFPGAQQGQPYGSMPPGPGGYGHQGPTPRPPGRSTGKTIAVVLASLLGVLLIGVIAVIGLGGVLWASLEGDQVTVMIEDGPLDDGEAMAEEAGEMPDELPVEPVPADSLVPEETADATVPDQPDGSIVNPTSPTEAACILAASGNSLENVFTTLTPEAEKAVIQAALDCLADPASNKDLVESTSQELEIEFNGEIQLDDAESSCLIRHTLDNTDDPVRALTTSDGPNDATTIIQGIVLCFDEADQEAFFRIAGAG